jgi:hypothetical protein
MSAIYKPLVIDIETIPHRIDEYLAIHPIELKKDGTPKKAGGKKGGIHALVSECVCVGLLDLETNIETVLQCIGPDRENCEKKILTDLCDFLRGMGAPAHVQFVTFNGFMFDFPLLRVRGMIRGIDVGAVLPHEEKRYPATNHIDLFALLGGKWASDVSAASLDDFLWAMTGTGKQSGGEQVAAWYAEGNHDAIRSHCIEDIQATAMLYRRMRGNFFF